MSEPVEAEETAPPTKVFVEWEGRDHPLGRVVRRRRRLADARNEGRVKPDVPGDIPDPGCLDVGDFLDELFFVAAVVLAIAVLVLYGPALIALLLELLLIVLITAVLIIAAVWRTLFRRPWRVVALRGWDEIWVCIRSVFRPPGDWRPR